MKRIAGIIALGIAAIALAQEFGPPPVAPSDAVEATWEDAKTLSNEERFFIRYIWNPDGELESFQATAHALNLIACAGVPYMPVQVDGPLCRVDLRQLFPRQEDLQEAINLWESFEFDPRFSLLITADTLKFAGDLNAGKIPRVETKRVRVATPPYVAADGKTYNFRWEEKQETVQVVRFDGVHYDQRKMGLLRDVLGTRAPIVTDGYFLYRALSTIQGKGLYKTLYGGLYYQFKGIKKSQKKGQTDEDLLYANLGLLENAKTLFDRLDSDQRVAVFRSGVTGKWRRVRLFRSPTNRNGTGLVAVTGDVKDDNIDIAAHPVMNVLDSEEDAREVIFEDKNGFHGFALFNGKGELQDEVPPDVANDTTIPAPHTQRLQPAISCVRCHKGWQPLRNDAKVLLRGLNAYGDRSAIGQLQPEVVLRIRGLYDGDPEQLDGMLPRGRVDYARAALKATGHWQRSKQADADIIELASDRIGKMYGEYWYDQVDEKKIVRELGTLGKLNAILAPPLNGLEDPRIGALAIGLKVNRIDADLSFGFMAARRVKRANP